MDKDVVAEIMESIPKEDEQNTESDNSPFLEESEVVHLLGITPNELATARERSAHLAEPYRKVWWQWRPAWRYRLKALEEYTQNGNAIREFWDGYRMPGERIFREMVARALTLGASDAHIQSDRRGAYLRFCIAGTLHPSAVVPPHGARYLASYLALMSGQDPRE